MEDESVVTRNAQQMRGHHVAQSVGAMWHPKNAQCGLVKIKSN
jgi:hypothetical protein